MSQPRLYVDPARWPGPVSLTEDEVHYLVHVLRLGEGEELEAFDGDGRRARAVLRRSLQGWTLQLEANPTWDPPKSRAGVILCLAWLKGPKLDEVVRMATELGVAAFEPFLSERCVARPDPAAAAARIGRLDKIAREAARQCGRADLPVVAPLGALGEVLARAGNERKTLLYEEARGLSLREWLAGVDLTGGLRLVVGPEGGFTPEEAQKAQAHGFALLRLGNTILRADTAAVAVATLACLGRGG